MTHLTLLRPLPAKWDGEPVRWSSHERVHGSINFHFREPCDTCGSQIGRASCRERV